MYSFISWVANNYYSSFRELDNSENFIYSYCMFYNVITQIASYRAINLPHNFRQMPKPNIFIASKSLQFYITSYHKNYNSIHN